MVKSYLKFEHSKTFGVVNAGPANIVWTPDGQSQHGTTRQTSGGKAVVAGNEEVLCWDVKKGELLTRWRDPDCASEVTIIAQSRADPDVFAVGYGDGSIRLWDSRTSTILLNFNGHRSAVTTLAFDRSGARLASGSKDTDIIIWDLIAEVGLFKLRGHKDQVTALQFLRLPSESIADGEGDGIVEPDSEDTFLLSTSKDALIKIWDVSSQHCIETHVAQTNGECWSLGVSPDQSGCITGGNDGELKMWSIDLPGLREFASHVTEQSDRRFFHDRGVLYRHGKDRTIGVTFHPTDDYFAVYGSEKAIEIWRIRSETEVKKHMARKKRRRQEKAASEKKEHPNGDAPDADKEEDAVPGVDDTFVSHVIVRTGGKVRAMDWASPRAKKGLQLIVAEANNQLEVYNVPLKEKSTKSNSGDVPDYSRSYSVDIPGHRTDIRSVSLSSDDRMLASASNGELKIWNVKTQNCIRTLECGYALCSAFLPGDKIVVVGTRSGTLELFDIASSALIDTVQAHEGAVWTLRVHPDGRSMASGSADKNVKFWDFTIVQEEIPGTKRTTPRLQLVHTRTLKLSDDILCLRFSPDSRLLAVSLLDNTVKVFFVDTLKMFLNLYGHKLPVLNIDISYDSKLIVTCSADKNVRLWGLDFGDCHKAFFAHNDSIMAVAFVPSNHDGNGHHFFSASKDRSIKYWDGDKFELIQTLPGHHGEIWALAISHAGDMLVSASHDKSVRMWFQTDEQIFLEEERERELENLYENTLTTSLEAEDAVAEGEEQPEVGAAGKQTTETLTAGERIIEALDLAFEDLAVMREYHVSKAANPKLAPPARHPIFTALGNISAEEHVFNVVSKIRAAALQDALLVLPFDKLIPLFTFLELWIGREWNVPLSCRIAFFMLGTHHRQIVASKALRPVLDRLRGRLRSVLGRQKDVLGFNLAAVKFLGEQARRNGTREFVDEETWEAQETGKGRKKRAFIDVA